MLDSIAPGFIEEANTVAPTRFNAGGGIRQRQQQLTIVLAAGELVLVELRLLGFGALYRPVNAPLDDFLHILGHIIEFDALAVRVDIGNFRAVGIVFRAVARASEFGVHGIQFGVGRSQHRLRHLHPIGIQPRGNICPGDFLLALQFEVVKDSIGLHFGFLDAEFRQVRGEPLAPLLSSAGFVRLLGYAGLEGG